MTTWVVDTGPLIFLAKQIEVASRSWLTIQKVKNRQAVEILQADLGPGESEAIVLAKEVGADRVVLDDLDSSEGM